LPDSPSRDDRLDALERRVLRLEETLLAAQDRPSLPVAEARTPEGIAVVPRAGEASVFLDVLAQTGWSVLALAGAFLVRALTDRGAMATAPGVALGLAYAFGVFVLADRGAARGNRLTAAFLGSTAAFIANAIVAETTTRFGIFEPTPGLGVLALATTVALALARRDDLPVIAWTGTLSACATAVFLAVKRGVPAHSGVLLLLLATAAFWLPWTRWSWKRLPWPPTLGAVALSIWATAGVLGPKEGSMIDGVAAMLLALGIAVLWPGSVLARALLRRPRVDALAVTQMLFALSVGFGGSLVLAHDLGREKPLAAAAVAGGIGATAFAFLWKDITVERGSRRYFAWLGLSLILVGTGVLLRDPAPALVWSGLALLAAVIAIRYEPEIFQAQTAVLATAAAAASGLFVISTVALTASDSGMRPETWPSVVVLAAVTGCAVLLLREKPAAGALPALAASLVAVLGLGALAVILLRRPAATVLSSPLPALRTVVLSLSAYALARLWRATGRRELRTLAYLALVAGGVKLLLEDVPSGTPLALFVAFVFYGGALLLVPRAMRATARPSFG
jgi:hypothetical protein